MTRAARIGKRTIDLVGASIGLVLTAPLFPVVALLIKATSKGPVFYTQRRCGVERRAEVGQEAGEGNDSEPPQERRAGTRQPYNTFQMRKFRSMRVDAEAATGAVLAQKNDPRLTPVGGFLRKTRLDELPQLLHVLSGEMSLIGPRPERPELMARIESQVPFFHERMRFIKPGVTGLAQIRLRYDGSFDQSSREAAALQGFFDNLELPGATDEELRAFSNKLLFDLAYSVALEDTWAWFRTDLEILLKTPWVMLRAKGR